MAGLDSRDIVAFTTHARQVPFAERDRLGREIRAAFAGRALVLETCHRVEGYAASVDATTANAPVLPAGGRYLVGEAAIRHAIEVAVGRDSVVIGEDQILHQLREAVAAAEREGGLDPVIARLVAIALRAGRRARSWRHGPTRSLADAAVVAIGRRIGSAVRSREVLVVGAGTMGRLAARALAAAGASVSIANRTGDRARAVAGEVGGQVEDLDPGLGIARFDAVVVAIAGPWQIAVSTGDALVAGAGVVVDLSAPAAVEPSTVARLGSRFISADDLAGSDDEVATADPRLLSRLDALVDETASEFLTWLEARAGRATAEALAVHADRERQAEIDELFRRLPDLGPEARAAIERMSRHLASRLLREPLQRLGRDADGRAEQAARELFAL